MGILILQMTKWPIVVSAHLRIHSVLLIRILVRGYRVAACEHWVLADVDAHEHLFLACIYQIFLPWSLVEGVALNLS